MKRVIIVSSNIGWESLWIDKILIKEYHTLEEGFDRGLLFLALAEKYELKFSDFQLAHTNEFGESFLQSGNFPVNYVTLLDMIELEHGHTKEYALSFLD